jgi:hypothetical protein
LLLLLRLLLRVKLRMMLLVMRRRWLVWVVRQRRMRGGRWWGEPALPHDISARGVRHDRHGLEWGVRVWLLLLLLLLLLWLRLLLLLLRRRRRRLLLLLLLRWRLLLLRDLRPHLRPTFEKV